MKKGTEKKHVTVALPLALYDRLTALAAETGRTRPGYIRWVLSSWVLSSWVLSSWVREIDEQKRGTD